jgi:hypothetical protein
VYRSCIQMMVVLLLDKTVGFEWGMF